MFKAHYFHFYILVLWYISSSIFSFFFFFFFNNPSSFILSPEFRLNSLGTMNDFSSHSNVDCFLVWFLQSNPLFQSKVMIFGTMFPYIFICPTACWDLQPLYFHRKPIFIFKHLLVFVLEIKLQGYYIFSREYWVLCYIFSIDLKENYRRCK